jgi:transcriptional regulator with XRE-family HTH domain
MVAGIGETLRNAREAKRLTLKDVSKDTNIVVKYLEALENEDFDKFPSETYLLGFLRSYAEYLKVDADELIQAYKGYKIGESSTPLEELTRPTGLSIVAQLRMYAQQYRNILYVAGIGIAVLIVISLFISLITSDVHVGSDDSIKAIQEEYYRTQGKKIAIKNIWPLQLTNDSGIVLLYNDEACQFLVENKEILFILSDIKDNSVIVEFLPDSKKYVLEMEKPVVCSPMESSRNIVLTLKGLTENRAKIRVQLAAVEQAKPDEAVTVVTPVTPPAEVVTHDQKNLKIVFEAEFVQKTYFELYLDGNERVRGMMPSGTKERWEASEFIQVKIGNAGGVKVKINGTDYMFGLPGQVANKVITWRKDPQDPNKYKLEVKDW